MRAAQVSKALVSSLCLAMVIGGCGILGVDMTSTPDSVRAGDPVTFDIKLTNHSACPVKQPLAELVAFVPREGFAQELFGELPPNSPPEIIEFVQQLLAFLDELCTGGNPVPPEPPSFSRSCTRGADEVACDFSGPAPAQEGNSGSFTFASVGNLLRCDVDAGTMHCRVRFPLPSAAVNSNAALGGAAAISLSLNCLVGLDVIGIGNGSGAVCFTGTPAMPQPLAAGAMATGQVALPARGAGFVRNLVFAINNGDVGVCKGGANAGQACSSGDDCPGSSCGEGICDGGGNDGKGCDVFSQLMDCPGGGTCVECDPDDPPMGFLPVDCTTTYISPEPAPIMSPWGLAGMAAGLLAAGSFWLRRKARHA